MQCLEVSCAVRHIYIYISLGAKGLTDHFLLIEIKAVFETPDVLSKRRFGRNFYYEEG